MLINLLKVQLKVPAHTCKQLTKFTHWIVDMWPHWRRVQTLTHRWRQSLLYSSCCLWFSTWSWQTSRLGKYNWILNNWYLYSERQSLYCYKWSVNILLTHHWARKNYSICMKCKDFFRVLYLLSFNSLSLYNKNNCVSLFFKTRRNIKTY